jgi:hypothetical protein
MADLASTAVSVDKISFSTLSNGIVLYRKECTVTLTGQGGTTNRILATAFGLSSVSLTSNWVTNDATPKIYPAVAAYAKDVVHLSDITNAVDASKILPVDVTGTLRCTVEGY